MPELPEVETVVRCLSRQLIGRRIVGVAGRPERMPRALPSDWRQLSQRPRAIWKVRRRGKWILIDLQGGLTLLVHLGMTGRLQTTASRAVAEPHTHYRWKLRPGDLELRFRDPRRFGSLGLLPTSQLEAFFTRAQLGPEPFDVAAGEFCRRLQSTARCLKAALLDQRLLAGLGNIYADEALFAARLHPEMCGHDLDARQARRLLAAVRRVLRRAIECKGTTIRDFLFDEDKAGGYQNEFQVYQRKGQPCRRCRAPIRQVRLAGRATHFCPVCQPAPSDQVEQIGTPRISQTSAGETIGRASRQVKIPVASAGR